VGGAAKSNLKEVGWTFGSAVCLGAGLAHEKCAELASIKVLVGCDTEAIIDVSICEWNFKNLTGRPNRIYLRPPDNYSKIKFLVPAELRRLCAVTWKARRSCIT
jgi:hypothetical protein